MADIGHGATITFGTSGFTGELRSISGPNVTVDSVDASYMGSTRAVKEFIPGMLDPGEVTLEMTFDPDELATNIPFHVRNMAGGLAAITETITVTWPLPVGNSTAANWSAQGFITGVSPEAPLDDLMTCSVTVKLTSDIGYTAAV